VEENLLAGGYTRRDGDSLKGDLDLVYTYFPRLTQRRTTRAGYVSGGEQQMLAIGRILRTGAEMLLLDEPTEGLAPVIIEQIGNAIRQLKNKGFTILLVEQNFRFAATVADRFYVVEHGQVIDMIPREELEARMGDVENYLGV
jgi:branched-chain amino acid transport system ATP-binding protein